jgi:hypothetical protein
MDGTYKQVLQAIERRQSDFIEMNALPRIVQRKEDYRFLSKRYEHLNEVAIVGIHCSDMLLCCLAKDLNKKRPKTFFVRRECVNSVFIDPKQSQPAGNRKD